VLPVTTLTLARSRLTSLGFSVAPDARHPFGTGNCCVFFEDRTYLEPITILDRNATDQAAAEGHVFVRRIKRFTERQGEGFAMVALQSDDAEADRAAFNAAGIGDGAVYRFSRKATVADGSEREIGVALAYTGFPAAPDASFFACQHLAKDVLFQPEYLEHPNGATGISAVIAVAEEPGAFRDFFAVLSGARQIQTVEGGIEVAGDAQRIVIQTPDAFRLRYDLDPPNPRRGMLLAAIELQASEIDRAARYADRAAKHDDARLVVPATPGLGAVIVFRSGQSG